MERIIAKIASSDSFKIQVQSSGKGDISTGDKNELKKVDAFKEHSLALTRHIENMAGYLHNEVRAIGSKIEKAKEILM
jgi:hypothetical protein